MKTDNTITKRILISSVLCLAYLLLSIFYYHISKHLSGPVVVILTLLIPITFIALVINTIIGMIRAFRNRHHLTFKSILPTIITLTTLTYIIFSPYRLDSERLESPVAIRACYEGTQNQATIKFRQDQSFEVNWTGVFGYDEWWTGQWKKNGDTLFLTYHGEKVEQLGDTLLIANGYLNPIGHSFDKGKFPWPMFYLGYCRHAN